MPLLSRPSRLPMVCASMFLLPLITGCSLSHFSDISTSPVPLPAMSGTVHGGQQPVSGATIQLYAANAFTSKGASIALIPALTPVITDAGGRFSLTGKYVCPTPGTSVYLTATGGNPGLAAGTANPGIALIAALGPCGPLFSGADNIFISINELTTVAAIEALAPFMADLTHIGADSLANPNAIANAMLGSNSIVPYSTGQFPLNPPLSLPTALYNTLANILAACINTAGNTGSTSNCAKLFAASGASADTVAAMLYIAQHPASNIAALYALVNSTAPFQPNLAAVPHDFTSALIINVPNTGEYRCCTDQRIAIDTSQQIWVANQFTQGVHVYSNAGALINTLTLPNPFAVMSSDPQGNVWFITTQNAFPYASITKFNSSGTRLSPPAGYQLDQGTGEQIFSYRGSGAALRFDSLGNFWIIGSSAAGKSCVMKFTSTATYLFSVCPTSFNSYTPTLAIDSSDNVYFAVANALYKFSPLGVPLFATPPSIYSIGGNFFMHYDPGTDHIWLFDGNYVTIYSSAGTVIKPRFQDALHFTVPFGLDGAGNAIAASGYPIGITQFDPTGTIILPPGVNPNDLYLGFQSYNALTTGVGYFEVDGLGNTWAVGGNNVLVRISGLATPRLQLYR